MLLRLLANIQRWTGHILRPEVSKWLICASPTSFQNLQHPGLCKHAWFIEICMRHHYQRQQQKVIITGADGQCQSQGEHASIISVNWVMKRGYQLPGQAVFWALFWKQFRHHFPLIYQEVCKGPLGSGAPCCAPHSLQPLWLMTFTTSIGFQPATALATECCS
jgi:hypothetical protein